MCEPPELRLSPHLLLAPLDAIDGRASEVNGRGTNPAERWKNAELDSNCPHKPTHACLEPPHAGLESSPPHRAAAGFQRGPAARKWSRPPEKSQILKQVARGQHRRHWAAVANPQQSLSSRRSKRLPDVQPHVLLAHESG